MRTQTGVLLGALGRCVFRIQPGCVCGGGRRRAARVLYGMRICARAAPVRTCAAPAIQVPPHTHKYGTDCRVQNRRSQAVKTMFGKPRKRWYRESSICAHAHALRKCTVHCTGLPCCVPNCPSAPHAHLRTLCACAHALRTRAHAHRCCQVLTLTVETTIRVLFRWDINTSPFKWVPCERGLPGMSTAQKARNLQGTLGCA